MKENLLCYCFSYTLQDIEEDFKKHDESTILHKIVASSKAGECSCKEMNPSGT